jgi:hypothetical protein
MARKSKSDHTGDNGRRNENEKTVVLRQRKQDKKNRTLEGRQGRERSEEYRGEENRYEKRPEEQLPGNESADEESEGSASGHDTVEDDPIKGEPASQDRIAAREEGESQGGAKVSMGEHKSGSEPE